MDIKELLGQTFTSITNNDDVIVFETSETKFKMHHQQDCCENVYIEDICGDLEDLVDSPILQAEESSSPNKIEDFSARQTFKNLQTEVKDPDYQDESETWTFYKFGTI